MSSCRHPKPSVGLPLRANLYLFVFIIPPRLAFGVRPTQIDASRDGSRHLWPCSTDPLGGGSGCMKGCGCKWFEACESLSSEGEHTGLGVCSVPAWVFGTIGLVVVTTSSMTAFVWSSSSKVDHEEGNERVERAAMFIRDAIDGVTRVHPRETWLARRFHYFQLMSEPALRFYSFALLVLTCLERPIWCQMHKARHSGESPCDSTLYPSFPIHYMRHNQHMMLELVLLLPFAMDVGLCLFVQGHVFWKTKRQTMRAIVLSMNLIDLVYAWLSPSSWFRAGHYLRILFVLDYSHATRSCFELVLRTLTKVWSLFFLAFLFIVAFGFTAVLLFPVETSEGEKYFPGLGAGMWSLLILITTANFPDVMMPAYHEARSSFLFFLAFIVFGIYFLVNLTTAMVCQAFDEQKNDEESQHNKHEINNIRQAYDQLSSGTTVTTETLVNLFHELNEQYPDIKYIKADKMDALLTGIDKDKDAIITYDEFKVIIPQLNEEARVTVPAPPLERMHPSIQDNPQWISIKAFVQSGIFDIFVNVILICSLLITLLQHLKAIQGKPESHSHEEQWNRLIMDRAICALYNSEMAFKIFVLGFGLFWKDMRNQFDLIIAIVSNCIMIYTNFSGEGKLQMRLITLIRLPRISTVLFSVEQYRVVAETFREMSTRISSVCHFLLLSLYLFSVLGVHIFGGVINKDERSPYFKRVNASQYAAAEYWENNFNDVPSGMVTLFELIVVNNWFVIVSGFSAACGLRARVFFIAFYVLGVLVTFNIVLAVVLSTFKECYAQRELAKNGLLALSPENRISILEDALEKLGADPLEILKSAAALRTKESDKQEEMTKQTKHDGEKEAANMEA